MYSMGFDPEVPTGYQDADIEMAEMAEAANKQYCKPCRSIGWIADWGTLGGEKPCPACGGLGFTAD